MSPTGFELFQSVFCKGLILRPGFPKPLRKQEIWASRRFHPFRSFPVDNADFYHKFITAERGLLHPVSLGMPTVGNQPTFSMNVRAATTVQPATRTHRKPPMTPNATFPSARTLHENSMGNQYTIIYG